MGLLLFLPGAFLAIMGTMGLIWPPRRPNWWYGYRTPRSMRGQESWDDANRLASLLLLLVGFLSLNTGLTCWFLTKRPEIAVTIVALVTSLLSLGIVAVVEVYLSRNFDRDGRPVRR